jgi:hypothetical protein
MAQLSNAYDTYQAKGVREDLHDMITKITPDETPLLSNLGTRAVTDTRHKWQIDDLASPDLDNAQVQGFEYDYDAAAATTEVSNITQIMSKEFRVANTLNAVKTAGRENESNYQKAKKAMEIRIDAEAILLSNQASVAGSGATEPRLGGLRAWIETNDQLGSGGASGGYNSGTTVVDAATNGTQRAFTKALLDSAIQGAYNSGGNATMMMLSPYAKTVFSGFMSDADVAQLRTNVSGNAATLVGAVDAYRSDFGTVAAVVNRQMARAGATIARNIFILDKTKAHVGWLRKIAEDKDVARTGDAKNCVLVGECTLIVDNEAAHASVSDVYGMSAAS